MSTVLHDKLVEVARAQRTVTYSDIALVVGLDMRNRGDVSKLSVMLSEESTYEHQQGRPLLSAVVVRHGLGTPGCGFYKLARELGRFTTGDEVAFFTSELQAVYAIWKASDTRSTGTGIVI